MYFPDCLSVAFAEVESFNIVVIIYQCFDYVQQMLKMHAHSRTLTFFNILFSIQFNLKLIIFQKNSEYAEHFYDICIDFQKSLLIPFFVFPQSVSIPYNSPVLLMFIQTGTLPPLSHRKRNYGPIQDLGKSDRISSPVFICNKKLFNLMNKKSLFSINGILSHLQFSL